MRKFAFLLLLVLIGIFTSLLNPTTVLAKGCCKSGFYVDPRNSSGCVPIVGTMLQIVPNECSPTETCNIPTQLCEVITKQPDICPTGKTLASIAYTALNGGKYTCCDTLNGPPLSCVNPVGCKPNKKIIYKFSGGKCIAEKTTDVFTCLQTGGICNTALGPIDTKPEAFVAVILKYALILGGLAIIFTLIMIGYTVLTSQGNPEKLQAAKEMAISLFTGFLFLVFSFTLLRIIGVDILGLPGIGP